MNRIELVEGEGPPPEAYSRVTNPERFEPVLRELAGRSSKTFDWSPWPLR